MVGEWGVGGGGGLLGIVYMGGVQGVCVLKTRAARDLYHKLTRWRVPQFKGSLIPCQFQELR